MMEDLIRLAGLVMLTSGAVAATRPKHEEAITPAPGPVASVLPATRERVEKTRAPEVEEFAKLPPYVRRQALGYARRWLESNFEPE